jgi:hypothetical protein
LAGEVIVTVGDWLGVTVTEACTVWAVEDGAVPVIVNWVVPALVVADVVKVSVELPPATTLAGLKLAVTPVGRLLATDRAMLCAEPDVTAVLIVYVAGVPAMTVCDVGAGVMLKSPFTEIEAGTL